MDSLLLLEYTLYLCAGAAVLLGTAITLAVTVSILKKAYRLTNINLPTLPTINLPKVQKKPKTIKQRRTEKMSQQREGTTFNDVFMFMIAVPLVLLWVGFAGFVIHSGLGDAAVLDNIESYTTLIAILGGPALLIIKDALDVWKQEQAEKTAFYKVKAQAVIDYNDAAQKQHQMIQSNQQAQEHKIEDVTTPKVGTIKKK